MFLLKLLNNTAKKSGKNYILQTFKTLNKYISPHHCVILVGYRMNICIFLNSLYM